MDAPLLHGTNPPSVHFWGIDIGGTEIKIGLVDAVGQTLLQTSVPTNAADGPEAALDRITNLITQWETSNPEL